MNEESVIIEFENNKFLPELFGEQDLNLARIEKILHVTAYSRGNIVAISGEAQAVSTGKLVLEYLYRKIAKGASIGQDEVDAAIRMIAKDKVNGEVYIKTKKKIINPYSSSQLRYIEALEKHDITFGIGAAGTGKTYIAVAMAVSMLLEKKVERIILSRPAIEAGEKLGFLPGTLKEKIDPYLRPLYDALGDMMPQEMITKLTDSGELEIAPLAYMRGRTLSNSFVILDEAQNTLPIQMKMFLTRIGKNSKMVITGDPTQSDLPSGMNSGLSDAILRLQKIEEIAIIKFRDDEIIRHPLIAKISKAYGSSFPA